MISFDNGPADGDYVRYIEAMARTAASAVAAQVGSMPAAATTMPGTGFDETSGQGRAGRSPANRAPATPAAAAAIARALALQNAGRVAVLPALGRAVGLALAGIVVAILGLFMQPTSVLVLIVGIALFVIGFRQASNATAAMRSGTRS